MRLSFLCLSLISSCFTPVHADFLGPSYSAPRDLSSDHSRVPIGWRNLTSTLQTYLDGDNQQSASANVAGIKNVTFSLGMFSLNDPAASKLQFHYTSPEIANGPNGTHKVDENSIYRIASVTKVFTVLVGLLGLKTTDWDRPLAEIFPELANQAQTNTTASDPVHMIQWDKVTPYTLAAQISGVTRDIFPMGPAEIIIQLIQAQGANIDPTALGLPPINLTNPQVVTPCASAFLNRSACTTVPYLESAKIQPPVFAPWTTPAYSDNGFILLGIVIANLTDKSLEQLYRDSIFDPLGMTSSNSTTPPESEWYRSVIPGDPAKGFAFDAGVAVSSGGLLSTTRDLAKFGIGILNSTLLPSDQTRRWLKPVSHTARLRYSIGRPWEIMRYIHSSGHVTDIYSKSGDSGPYSSWLVLLPDYNAGFSVLTAGSATERYDLAAVIADLITDSILPSLEAQAAAEAECNFAGTYTSKTHNLNSSLTLVHNQTEASPPGIVISSWISNGTDMISTFAPSLGLTPWRLVPSISDSRNGKALFWLVSGDDAPSPSAPTGLFSGPGYLNSDWIDVDSTTYEGVGLGSFVFDVKEDGKATAVSPSALRITLDKCRC